MVDDAGDPEATNEELGGPEQPNAERALNPAPERVGGDRLAGLAVILGAAVVIAAVVYAYIGAYPGPEEKIPEVVLLIAGFVTVTLLLYLGTIILRALDLGAAGEALGMPPGSIRALIAMSLILIFAIAGFVIFKTGGGNVGKSTGVTQAQIDQLRQDGVRVTSLALVSQPGQPAVYDVETVVPLSPDAHDFGLQLLSVVSTLVVAVAGFYFGAQTVNQAGRETRAQLGMIQQARMEAIAAGVIGAKPDPAAAAAAGSVVTEPPVVDVETIGEGPGDGDGGGGGGGAAAGAGGPDGSGGGGSGGGGAQASADGSPDGGGSAATGSTDGSPSTATAAPADTTAGGGGVGPATPTGSAADGAADEGTAEDGAAPTVDGDAVNDGGSGSDGAGAKG
jgi:uncharacterized membrane protein YgcG